MKQTKQTRKYRAGKFSAVVLFLFLFSAPAYRAWSQQPFENEIVAFKAMDSVKPPPAHPILFVGSSSFRLWKDLPSDFKNYPIINRGFGGSTLPDVIRYANDIILPYQPKQVVIYCGDNDLAASDTVTAQTVAQRFEQLFAIIRKGLPGTRISYVSIKPSPSRQHLIGKMKEANALIKGFLKARKNTSFIDVFTPMLGPDKKPRPDIFLGDNLHMNRQGYQIWKKTIQPYLVK